MNRASLSDYAYHVRGDGKKPVIVIEDLNLGRMSVTNNIEAVVEAVRSDTALTADDALIIYRDSDGIYDGVRDHNGVLHFYPLGQIKEENEAVAAALSCNPQG